MKPSSPSLLKSLAKSIHPPLIVTPLESKKLLHLLQASFRKQLNDEHPVHSKEPSPTSAHLQSILSSPLFGQPRERNARKNRDAGPLLALAEMQDSLISPMTYFNEQVAAGNATLGIAKHCLQVERQNSTVFRGAMASAAPGTHSSLTQPILNWLWASSLGDSMEFFYDN